MASLAFQQVKTTGLNLSTSAAGGSGDTLPPDEDGALFVRNGSGSTLTVTVVVPGSEYGKARPDATFDVPAAGFAFIGPLPNDLADPTDGRVHFTYSATSSVLVAGVRI